MRDLPYKFGCINNQPFYTFFMVISVVFNAVKRRRSIRSYLEKEIEDEKLNIILESARLDPSATNAQDWFFYAVKDKEKRAKITSSMPFGMNPFLKEAPIIIVGCKKTSGLLHKVSKAMSRKSWSEINVTIALENMALTAADLDIGSCWIGLFDEQKIRQILNIPVEHEIVALLSIGYPTTTSTEESIGGVTPKPRLSLKEIVKVI
jgi:nitroreductase